MHTVDFKTVPAWSERSQAECVRARLVALEEQFASAGKPMPARIALFAGDFAHIRGRIRTRINKARRAEATAHNRDQPKFKHVKPELLQDSALRIVWGGAELYPVSCSRHSPVRDR